MRTASLCEDEPSPTSKHVGERNEAIITTEIEQQKHSEQRPMLACPGKHFYFSTEPFMYVKQIGNFENCWYERGEEARGRDAVDIRATTVALILSLAPACATPRRRQRGREGRTRAHSAKLTHHIICFMYTDRNVTGWSRKEDAALHALNTSERRSGDE